MQDEVQLHLEAFRLSQIFMSLKLFYIHLWGFMNTLYYSAQRVLAVCIPCKKCLLDIPARNICFLQEEPWNTFGLASAVTNPWHQAPGS